jgi:hypothetical protein
MMLTMQRVEKASYATWLGSLIAVRDQANILKIPNQKLWLCQASAAMQEFSFCDKPWQNCAHIYSYPVCITFL